LARSGIGSYATQERRKLYCSLIRKDKKGENGEEKRKVSNSWGWEGRVELASRGGA